MNNVLYLPMLGLVTLTVVVWGMAVYRRVREIRMRRIPLQSLAQARQVAVAFEDVQAMDNFNNLLQVPVLFYVLCLAVAQSGSGGELFLAGAWAYVLLRVLHSAIQITHNRVPHRFYAWLTSNLILIALWIKFAVDVLRAA